ncbi:methyltransferase domain-containing protein [Sandaracinobacteroides saxicola]|uniref:Methyltransferase domain-containing protein n=2 Tax=Sandaracinobacteroides saxicola TaxID=2759707 RepID=A0A7G5IMQ5_9SPHN|nr:methyltransferase domain-containing protein [Sandaracinobacteroides saxicola]
MDTHDVSEADFAACLRDLEAVNALTFAAPPTLGFLSRATAGWEPGRPLRVLDCGSGQGGMLRRIHRWATAKGFVPDLVGVDLNPRSRAAALAATPADMAIEWRTTDIFDVQADDGFDVIISALFAHHLDDADLPRFLRWMEATAARGWFINDLHRHWFAWGGFTLLSQAMRWHRFVRHDGPLSVRRAFVSADWRRLLAEAGIADATLRWHPLFRLCVSRLK